MEVSQFELVYKPQSPAGPADTVLQGYFLEISNLEKKTLEFNLRFTTSRINDPDRNLFNNARAFIDSGDSNNSTIATLTGSSGSKSFGLSKRVVVPAHGTALVALLPSDPFSSPMVPVSEADFECRGYVTITLPALSNYVSNGPLNVPFFGLEPQADGPVKVLLTPQLRAVYSDANTGATKGQTQSSLPLATGKALHEIEPGTGRFVIENERFELAESMLPELGEIPFTDALAAMLSVVQRSDMDMSAFNKALKTAGIGMAIESRKI